MDFAAPTSLVGAIAPTAGVLPEIASMTVPPGTAEGMVGIALPASAANGGPDALAGAQATIAAPAGAAAPSSVAGLLNALGFSTSGMFPTSTPFGGAAPASPFGDPNLQLVAGDLGPLMSMFAQPAAYVGAATLPQSTLPLGSAVSAFVGETTQPLGGAAPAAGTAVPAATTAETAPPPAIDTTMSPTTRVSTPQPATDTPAAAKPKRRRATTPRRSAGTGSASSAGGGTSTAVRTAWHAAGSTPAPTTTATTAPAPHTAPSATATTATGAQAAPAKHATYGWYVRQPAQQSTSSSPVLKGALGTVGQLVAGVLAAGKAKAAPAASTAAKWRPANGPERNGVYMQVTTDPHGHTTLKRAANPPTA